MSTDALIFSEPGAALLPLERFHHPALQRRPTNIVAEQADRQMDMLVRKQCAGLRYGLRITGARLRRAFMSGRFRRNDRIVLEWTISGMREVLFPTWHSLCALTIYELARGMGVMGPEAGGYAGYLNQWAEDPSRPLPSAAGWTLYLRNFSLLPPAAIGMLAGDPRREDIAEIGASVLDLDGLRYSVPTGALRELQIARGIGLDSRNPDA